MTTVPYALYQIGIPEHTFTVDSVLEHVGMEVTFVLQYMVEDEWVTEVLVDRHWNDVRPLIVMALDISNTAVLVHAIGGTVINCLTEGGEDDDEPWSGPEVPHG